MTTAELADEVVAKAEARWHYFYTDKSERFGQSLKIWVMEAIKKATDEIHTSEVRGSEDSTRSIEVGQEDSGA